MINGIRTITIKDAWIYESPDSRGVSDSKQRARKVLDTLQSQKAAFDARLRVELASGCPDLQKVARLREILDNITHSLNMHSR